MTDRKAQYLSFGAAFIGWTLDAFDFTIFLLLMPRIAKQFGVTVQTTTLSITLTLLVRLIGSLVAGWVADRYGRKLPLMISLVWFALCDGAVYFAPSFAWVLVFRTLFGFGMGAEWTAGSALALENWPKSSRNIASGILQSSWALGYLLAAMVVPVVVEHWGWRMMFLVAAAPALLALPVRVFVPESREWRANAAAKMVSQSLLKYWRPILFATLLIGAEFCTYYGLASLYPTMLQKEFSFALPVVSHYVIWFNVGMLFGTLVCGVLGHKYGPLRTIALFALGSLPFFSLYVGHHGHLLIGAIFSGGIGLGFAGVTASLLVAIFPPAIRAKAMGLVYHCAAFIAAFVPMLISWLATKPGASLHESILRVGVASQLAVLLAIILVARERKNATS